MTDYQRPKLLYVYKRYVSFLVCIECILEQSEQNQSEHTNLFTNSFLVDIIVFSFSKAVFSCYRRT